MAIGSSVQEQGAATAEISRNAQSAASGTESLGSDVEDVAATIGEAEHAARSVKSVSDDLAREAETLRTAVDGFLTRVKAA